MNWWNTAIYDTCSLITIANLLEVAPTFSRHLPTKILALEVSFSADQMRPETAQKLFSLVNYCQTPTFEQLQRILSSSNLPKSLSEVDRLLFATAVHLERGVVTADKHLAQALRRCHLQAIDIASIMRELVQSGRLRPSYVEKLVRQLADRKDYILGIPNPTLADLKRHTFP